MNAKNEEQNGKQVKKPNAEDGARSTNHAMHFPLNWLRQCSPAHLTFTIPHLRVSGVAPSSPAGPPDLSAPPALGPEHHALAERATGLLAHVVTLYEQTIDEMRRQDDRCLNIRRCIDAERGPLDRNEHVIRFVEQTISTFSDLRAQWEQIPISMEQARGLAERYMAPFAPDLPLTPATAAMAIEPTSRLLEQEQRVQQTFSRFADQCMYTVGLTRAVLQKIESTLPNNDPGVAAIRLRLAEVIDILRRPLPHGEDPRSP